MFIGQYHLSNLITYLGMAAAMTGIGHAMAGRTTTGMICLIICGVCDLFDGLFARQFRRNEAQKDFGVQIDSLADVLSFAALPVALMFSVGFTEWYQLVMVILYGFAALTRLAHFNQTVAKDHGDHPQDYYRGVPVTYAAFFFGLGWLLHYTSLVKALPLIYTAMLGLLGLSFVLDIPVKKPRGAAYAVFGLLAVAAVAAMLILE